MRRARRGTRGGRARVAAAPEGCHRADRRAAHARTTRRRVAARRRSAARRRHACRRSTRSSPVRAAQRPRPTPGNGALVTRRLEPMDVYEALYTTRAMRRVKPDPIPLDVQKKILDAAIRAPSGGNTQNWRFMLVDDPAVKAQIAPIYQECLGMLWADDLQGSHRSCQREPRRSRERADAARAAVRAAPRRSLRGVPAAPHQLRAVRPDRRIDLPVHVVGDARGASRRHRRIAHDGREHDQGRRHRSRSSACRKKMAG